MKKIEVSIPKKFKQAAIVVTVCGQYGREETCKFITEEEMNKNSIVKMEVK